MTFYQTISTWWHKHPVLMNFLLGASIGFIASTVYLISGGDTFLFVPAWASVLFYPGFVAGNFVYSAFGYSGAVIIGILVIGLTYGLIALCIGQLLRVSHK